MFFFDQTLYIIVALDYLVWFGFVLKGNHYNEDTSPERNLYLQRKETVFVGKIQEYSNIFP